MSEVRFSPEADADLEAIGDYISQDKSTLALTFVAELRAKCALLGDNPFAGPAVRGGQPNLRYFPTGHYVIFYRPAAFGVEIVRDLHGARDLARLL